MSTATPKPLRRRALATVAQVAVLAIAVAGCNGSAATQAASTAAPAGGPTAAGQTVSGALGSSGIPGLDTHAAPDLEAMLPSTIGTTPLLKLSVSLAQVSALSGATGGGDSGFQTFTSWVQALGKSPNDVNMALATSLSSNLSVGAIRVKGANQDQLVSSFAAAATSQSGLAATQANLGGKSVIAVTDQTSSPRYVYARDDVLFFVDASDDATAGAALKALP